MLGKMGEDSEGEGNGDEEGTKIKGGKRRRGRV